MEIGESIELDGVVYQVTKKINEYMYEITEDESGAVVPYAVGRTMQMEKENVGI